MMSSRPESPTQATGAHRAHRDARQRVVPRSVPHAPPARYEPCLDGLFTYCLSVLCDHDAATTALGDVLAIAERRGSRGPAAASELRPWLYALARWVCLRALADARRKRQGGAHASGGSASPKASASAAQQPDDETDRQRRRELAQLAWPEAAGTTPEQREALELAVRHQLAPQEVAAVVGLDLGRTRDLLASAACEVERTRAALAVVETGTCPIVARLTGDNQLLLGTALRRELVRHVDDCPRCRLTAERAGSGAWPGTAASPAALPVVAAPRPAVHVAMAHVPRARGGAPRFDRRGFPMDPKDHAARRHRLRARAVTTTVVATVIAAPVLALWAAYRGAPLTGEGADGTSVSATEAGDSDGMDGDRRREDYENAGNAQTPPDPRFTAGSRSPDVSVEVISGGSPPSHSSTGPGRLTVAAQPSGGTTLITLRASGGEPVRWSASAGASWLYLSRSSGTLSPGETFTLRVYVDHDREPAGHWSARVSIAPAGAIVSIDGYGRATGPTTPVPRPTPTDPTPTPTPTPTPSDPEPTPTPTDPTPTPTPSPTDGSGEPSPSEG
ncbi:hypothetical protein OG453_01495 [Streptomyces sp. NBC_01381]|uniref:BACON domain-containing protein n=1 Tax=Streptomyces sp. NBC_01381 TaxID=2903845 RepID=UPI00225BA884|nr:hypothetical protein [Streptomyces sp. NBC_01381]MCX4665356.1 hypothetical protein [Streptomyces sp. NBC_01381]